MSVTLMRTFPSGKNIDPCNIRPDDIESVDVAHHLSMLCRFTGAVREFYSVGQHSCLVSTLLRYNGAPKPVAFAGQMHDTPEYLLGDCGTPLKNRLPDYHYYEDKAWPVFVRRFGIQDDVETRRLVKAADEIAFRIEARALQGRYDALTSLDVLPLGFVIPPYLTLRGIPPAEAKKLFCNLYVRLMP